MIAALVGGQYGSEGKGLIAGHIGKRFGCHVRVGAANAGHTVVVDGSPFVLQQIPCAAYTSPNSRLVVGPGAVISEEILLREIEENTQWRLDNDLPSLDLYIDRRAHVITDLMIEREQESDLAERIGSTSTIAKEGIGTATAARAMRDSECVVAADVDSLQDWISDTVGVVLQVYADMEGVLLEGTQGTGLSITTGQFPYCTSRNTTAAGLVADAGVPLTAVERSIMVCRTFPIRVAGNSGPFWHDSEELEWEDLKVDPNTERTTVTKKVRRVASFSFAQVAEAAWLNGATDIAITFTDYLDFDIYGKSGEMDFAYLSEYFPIVAEFVDKVATTSGVPVSMLGTGPATVIDLVQ